MEKGNVLVIGSGGREHAIVHAFSKSPKVNKIFVVPGNAGTRVLAENVYIAVKPPFTEIIDFAKSNNISLTFVGPEKPLTEGIVDAFEKASLRVCGPNASAARLEGSKIFTKRLLKKYNIPTASYEEFSNYEEALAYIEDKPTPFVLKADGLAAGKGVIIATDTAEAKQALKAYFKDKHFGEAGNKIIIEDFLYGEEASILAFTDGEDILLLPPSQDHKRIFDDDKGPNTGGMGAYSPIKLISEATLERIKKEIIMPTIEALKKEGITYKGVLYAGLMLDNGKPSVVEFNCRLGDPECQVVLPLLKTDLYEIAEAVIENRVSQIESEYLDKQAITVVASSKGYPGEYVKNTVIEGDINYLSEDIMVYHAGVSYNDKYLTSGGRVFTVTAIADSLKEAREKAYSFIGKKVYFEGMHFRKDIASKGM